MASKRDDPDSVGEGNVGVDALANGAMGSGSGTVLIDLDFVRALIAAVDGSGIDTLEISRGGTKVRISKSPVPAAVLPASPVAVAATAARSIARPLRKRHRTSKSARRWARARRCASSRP
jgi:hypothetical protein